MAQKAIRTSVFSWEGTDRKGSKVKALVAHPGVAPTSLMLTPRSGTLHN